MQSDVVLTPAQKSDMFEKMLRDTSLVDFWFDGPEKEIIVSVRRFLSGEEHVQRDRTRPGFYPLKMDMLKLWQKALKFRQREQWQNSLNMGRTQMPSKVDGNFELEFATEQSSCVSKVAVPNFETAF